MGYEQEKIKPYNEGEKGKQVEQMFDNIAPTYDQLNHRLSWNIDRGWRRKAIRQLAPYKPRHVLDIATGTGDFAILAAHMLQPEQLSGTDISEGMMDIGRRKVKALGLDNIVSFAREDCMALTFQDNTFSRDGSLWHTQLSRLRQGTQGNVPRAETRGHLSVVELTTPVSFPMKQLFSIYSHTILPVYGRLISKRHQRLQLSDAHHRGIPAGRTHDGHSEEGRLQRDTLRTAHLRHLHHVFRNQIN